MADILSDSETNASHMSEPLVLTIDEQRMGYMVPGLSGLVNLGNTCYMNAALQCLVHTDVFAGYFKSGIYKNDLKHGIIRSLADAKRKALPDGAKLMVKLKQIKNKFRESITYKFRNTLLTMWSVNCRVKPKELKYAIGLSNSMFAGFNQHDSQEFIGFLLDKIHEESKTDVTIDIKKLSPAIEEYIRLENYYTNNINDVAISPKEKAQNKEKFMDYRKLHLKEDAIHKSLLYWQNFIKKNHSVIIDIFTGLYLNSVQCKQCDNVSFSFQPENTLPLCIEQGHTDVTLEECLTTNFVSEENLSHSCDNAYKCTTCNTLTDAVKKVHIWHAPPCLIIMLKRFYNNGSYLSRNNRVVKFPISNLNISKYCSEYNKLECMYDLYAVVCQSGSLRGGHYIAYVKNMLNNEWYKYDDSNVLHIDSSRIENILHTNDAYVLFYKRRGQVNLITMDEDNVNIDD